MYFKPDNTRPYISQILKICTCVLDLLQVSRKFLKASEASFNCSHIASEEAKSNIRIFKIVIVGYLWNGLLLDKTNARCMSRTPFPSLTESPLQLPESVWTVGRACVWWCHNKFSRIHRFPVSIAMALRCKIRAPVLWNRSTNKPI